MILAKMHEAKTSLSQLVAAAEKGETVILCRGNQQVAEIIPRRPRKKVFRDLTPKPELRVTIAPGYKLDSPLSEEEWPEELR